MAHGNARKDRFLGSVPAQTPTTTAHIMNAKHMKPDLPTQAQTEP